MCRRRVSEVADSKGFLGWCEVQCVGQAEVVLQKNQVLGVLFPLLSNIDIFLNKLVSFYTVFRTFGISLGLKPLAEPP